jgi:hypothetical protein
MLGIGIGHQRPAHALVDLALDLLVSVAVRLRRDTASHRALSASPSPTPSAPKTPALTERRAFLSANVVVQTVSGMTRLFAESAPQDQPTVVADYKVILTAYGLSLARRSVFR